MPIVDTSNYNSVYEAVSKKLSSKQGSRVPKNDVCLIIYCFILNNSNIFAIVDFENISFKYLYSLKAN